MALGIPYGVVGVSFFCEEIIYKWDNLTYPIGSMYAIYGNIYHQYTPNVSIYTIHGSYGYMDTIVNHDDYSDLRMIVCIT